MRADLESLGAYLDKLKQKYLFPFEEKLKQLESIAKGSQSAISFEDYNTMITELNTMSSEDAFVGLNILIVTLNVPDLWISEILAESSPYIYVSDDYFVEELRLNGKVQIGHFVVSPLETLKVDLTDYVKNTDYANNTNAGVFKTDGVGWSGLYMATDHVLKIQTAKQAEIDAKLQVYMPITPRWLDYAVKVGITTNTETLTDEQKANACDWLGALPNKRPANSNNGDGFLITFGTDGKTLGYKRLYGGYVDDPYSVPYRDGYGVIHGKTPKTETGLTPKGYVDNLPDKLTLTDEQKAKWRAWLGIE